MVEALEPSVWDIPPPPTFPAPPDSYPRGKVGGSHWSWSSILYHMESRSRKISLPPPLPLTVDPFREVDMYSLGQKGGEMGLYPPVPVCIFLQFPLLFIQWLDEGDDDLGGRVAPYKQGCHHDTQARLWALWHKQCIREGEPVEGISSATYAKVGYPDSPVMTWCWSARDFNRFWVAEIFRLIHNWCNPFPTSLNC